MKHDPARHTALKHDSNVVIDAHELVKTYDADKIPVHAVNGVHLHIERGEFVALRGPSGSGKTTVLNMIGGLDRPTSGHVSVDGVDIGKLTDNQLIDFRLRHIGFVFQSYNLIPVFTARENIEFTMLLQGRPRTEIDARVDELLRETGLEDKADKRPNELSGGQQQRVAVARAWRPSRNSCWPTSPPPTSIPSPPSGCWTPWRSSTPRSTSPSSSAPTTSA